jgi:hypothetical protein
MNKETTILVIAQDETAGLIETLASIGKQSLPHLDLSVVLNSSDTCAEFDALRNQLREPKITSYVNGNSSSVNLRISGTASRFVLLIDSGVELASNFLEKSTQALFANSNLAAICAGSASAEGDWQPAFDIPSILSGQQPPDLLLVRRELLLSHPLSENEYLAGPITAYLLMLLQEQRSIEKLAEQYSSRKSRTVAALTSASQKRLSSLLAGYGELYALHLDSIMLEQAERTDNLINKYDRMLEENAAAHRLLEQKYKLITADPIMATRGDA